MRRGRGRHLNDPRMRPLLPNWTSGINLPQNRPLEIALKGAAGALAENPPVAEIYLGLGMTH